MQLSLLAVGKVKKAYLREGCDDYFGRLKHYVRSQAIEVRDEPVRGSRTPDQVKEQEALRLLAKVPEGAFVLALDERGESLSTQNLADQLLKWRDTGRRDVVFIIGGPLGLHDSVRQRADRILTLSAFTLPHELARLLLLEQLYRAFTVIAGEPYHNP